MLDFLINNPFLLFVLVCCLWPLVMFGTGTVIGSLIARRGLPRLAWPSSSPPTGERYNDADM
jgi:hypothetical protein